MKHLLLSTALCFCGAVVHAQPITLDLTGELERFEAENTSEAPTSATQDPAVSSGAVGSVGIDPTLAAPSRTLTLDLDLDVEALTEAADLQDRRAAMDNGPGLQPDAGVVDLGVSEAIALMFAARPDTVDPSRVVDYGVYKSAESCQAARLDLRRLLPGERDEIMRQAATEITVPDMVATVHETTLPAFNSTARAFDFSTAEITNPSLGASPLLRRAVRCNERRDVPDYLSLSARFTNSMNIAPLALSLADADRVIVGASQRISSAGSSDLGRNDQILVRIISRPVAVDSVSREHTVVLQPVRLHIFAGAAADTLQSNHVLKGYLLSYDFETSSWFEDLPLLNEFGAVTAREILPVGLSAETESSQ
jgi:hypothetical protein